MDSDPDPYILRSNSVGSNADLNFFGNSVSFKRSKLFALFSLFLFFFFLFFFNGLIDPNSTTKKIDPNSEPKKSIGSKIRTKRYFLGLVGSILM